jgi:long-chain acyl-CoA synthetase
MGKTTTIADRTLLDALARHLATRADKPAYRKGDDILSFSDVARKTNQIANALTKAGIRRGDRVACLTKHHIECMLLTLAACKVGAVCMPVNWRLAPPEVRYILTHGLCRLVMADAMFLSQFEEPEWAEAAPAGTIVLCTDGSTATFRRFDEWYSDCSEKFAPVEISEEDEALQLYSSGTTGLPKGVVLTHKGLVQAVRLVEQQWQFDENCVFANCLPTFHIAGMTMILLTLQTGGQTSAFSEFDPDVFIDRIAQHKVTHSFLVPAMLLFVLQSPRARSGDYRTLRLLGYGGSPISETVLKDAMQTFGCDFVQAYGLTEITGTVSFLMPQDHHLAATNGAILRSAGKPVPDVRVRIVDPLTLKDAAEKETGEIWVESIRNLKEYWRDAEATRLAFPEGRNERGGWFRTGDAAYMDDGYIFIHDPIKDMIISGGENIYPAEIENVLMMHPCVADAAIIGVPDPVWGESVKACVVVKQGANESAERIIHWVRERLAHYKCPKSVDFVRELPRNPSGKVLKRILREPYWRGKQRAVN